MYINEYIILDIEINVYNSSYLIFNKGVKFVLEKEVLINNLKKNLCIYI